MNDIQIDLYRDWIDTVKVIFRGSGQPLTDNISDAEAALAYFMETAASEEEAMQQRDANEKRLYTLQNVILDNFETVIISDIRSRTGYSGNKFIFKWVYNKGEHIIEQHSAYRIPL